MSEVIRDVQAAPVLQPDDGPRPLSATECSTGPDLPSAGQEAARISVDDLKRKATRISDLAQAELHVVARQPMSRYVVVGAVVFVTALSIAYFAGASRARRDA